MPADQLVGEVYTPSTRPANEPKSFILLVAPQGSTSTDFTGVIAFFNRYTPMRTPVCLLLEWLVRFPYLLALPSTDLDITEGFETDDH